MKRRCSWKGSSTSGIPSTTVPILPCHRWGISAGRRRASPSITWAPGSRSRRCSAMSRYDFDHKQALRRQAAVQQRLADHTGAGAELDHSLVGCEVGLRNHAPAQRRAARHDRAHLQRIGEPAAKEQASVGNVLAKRSRLQRVCGLFHSGSPKSVWVEERSRQRRRGRGGWALLDLGFLERDVLAHNRIVTSLVPSSWSWCAHSFW